MGVVRRNKVVLRGVTGIPEVGTLKHICVLWTKHCFEAVANPLLSRSATAGS